MKQKLKTILLIDDDSATNFINAHLLKMLGYAENIVVRENGREALDYLREESEEGNKPDLIFLDINMPCMNGWEFLEEYKKLDHKTADSVIIVMLTTSPLLDDQLKATAMAEIAEFRNKPLNKAMLQSVLKKHFPALVDA
jgi:CheY-like chemotaxis protein